MAAGASRIQAGEAFIPITGDESALKQSLRRSEGLLGRFAKRSGKAFAAAAGALKRITRLGTVAIGAAFTGGSIAAAKFENQMAAVATLLSETQLKLIPQMAASVRKLSKEFGESTAPLSKGLFDIISASVPAAKAMEVLEVSLKAAKAGLTDTGTAADAITTILNSYSLSADKAASVSDLFFAINKRGKTTFAELAPAIGNVASTAASAGVSLEGMGAALATMTRAGLKTEVAVTSLQAIIATFLKPADEAKKIAKKLGFEMDTATLKSEGLAGVFEKLKDVSPEEIAKIFPNLQALKGVNPILQNMAGFMQDMALMTNRAGLAQEAFNRQTSTLTFSFNKLKQSTIDVFRALGDLLSPALESLFNRVAKLLSQLADWIRGMNDIQISFIRFGATIERVLVKIQDFAKNSSFAMNVLGEVISTVLGGLVKAIPEALNLALSFNLSDQAKRDLEEIDKKLAERIKKIKEANKEAKFFNEFGKSMDLAGAGKKPTAGEAGAAAAAAASTRGGFGTFATRLLSQIIPGRTPVQEKIVKATEKVAEKVEASTEAIKEVGKTAKKWLDVIITTPRGGRRSPAPIGPSPGMFRPSAIPRSSGTDIGEMIKKLGSIDERLSSIDDKFDQQLVGTVS